MLQTTLGIMVKEGKIFLGEKKKGFAMGVLNGVGGKQEGNESIENCMIREAKEEIGIEILEQEKVGIMHFYFENKPDWNLDVHLFNTLDYSGKITESDEIKPFWFNLDEIPYDKMWEFDKNWLPRVLNGEKDIEYSVWYNTDNGKVLKSEKIK